MLFTKKDFQIVRIWKKCNLVYNWCLNVDSKAKNEKFRKVSKWCNKDIGFYKISVRKSLFKIRYIAAANQNL